MIKDVEKFMELDSQYEEMKILIQTYSEIGDMAYDKAIMCLEQNDLISYGVWTDLVEMSNWYIEEINDDIERIKEQLQKLVDGES